MGLSRAPFNWSLYIFYGGDLRASGLPWLRAQISQIADLPPVDDDGDMPIGFFLLTDELSTVTAWEIHGGSVHDRPAPELAWTFRE